MPDETQMPDELAAAAAEAQRLLSEWPKTVKLAVPIQFGKELIEELVFQKGNFGILKGLSIPIDRMPHLDEIMTIASRLCGRPAKVIELLDPADAKEVSDVATIFFGRCRGAGKSL